MEKVEDPAREGPVQPDAGHEGAPMADPTGTGAPEASMPIPTGLFFILLFHVAMVAFLAVVFVIILFWPAVSPFEFLFLIAVLVLIAWVVWGTLKRRPFAWYGLGVLQLVGIGGNVVDLMDQRLAGAWLNLVWIAVAVTIIAYLFSFRVQEWFHVGSAKQSPGSGHVPDVESPGRSH